MQAHWTASKTGVELMLGQEWRRTVVFAVDDVFPVLQEVFAHVRDLSVILVSNSFIEC